MKCEFDQSDMLKIVDENVGISYECPTCGHTVDIYYTRGNDANFLN